MNDHGGALVQDGGGLYEEPSGMEQGEDDEHGVIKMKFKEDIGVEAVEEGLAVRKDGAFGLARGS